MWKHRLLTLRVVPAVGMACWSTVGWSQENRDTAPPATVSTGNTTTVVVTPPSAPPAPAATTPSVNAWGLPPAGYNPDKGLPSSSREAGSGGFDINGGGAATMHGGQRGDDASLVVSGRSISVPYHHTVARGDTLWDLCQRYYENPWAWPRVWSFNPQVQNPHWIYPGDRLRMRAGGSDSQSQTVTGQGFVHRQSTVPAGTVFLRDQGYIADEARDVWGEVVGSPGDTMLLAQGSAIYLEIKGSHDIRIGQEFSVFKRTRAPEAGDAKGYVVRILGTARIDKWNEQTKIAEATLTESLDVIDRGSFVGPIGRRFDVVPPARNDLDVWGHIAGGIDPREILGQDHVVFVDRGSKEGLRPGNRLFVVAQGDRWRDSIRVGRSVAANRVHYELRKAQVEPAPDTGADVSSRFPREVIGEIRVLRTEEHSSICLVTYSVIELESGLTVVARRGY